MSSNQPISKIKPTIPIRGRFAPSPTGALHLGSLVAAVASYLIAKQAGGEWLIRIEDLDPPREVPGSAKLILDTLEGFGFEWDHEVLYQSQRNHQYQQVLQELIEKQIVYRCDCSRKMVEERNAGVYDGFCKGRKLQANNDVAFRVKFKAGFEQFEDRILGGCQFSTAADKQDFVLKRRDGLFAYQLAVVADDISQGITQVVRGSDILDSTPRQNFLYDCLATQPPEYYHLPLVLGGDGQKYSKRFSADGIDQRQASEWLCKALIHLGQVVETEIQNWPPRAILEHYIDHWQTSKVNQKIIETS